MAANSTPQEQKFLKILQTALTPFEKFVAKADIEENLPLVRSRSALFDELIKLLQNDSPYQLIPIFSETGIGKTHILWQIKRSVKIHAPALFLEVPSNDKTFFYVIYTEIIETIGAQELREITAKIANNWGANEKKYGLFRTSNTQKIILQAENTDRYKKCKHKQELEQIIKVILAHAMDPEKMVVAERWLLGEHMDPDDLAFLGIDFDLTYPYMAEELLQLLLGNLENGIILMFDDLDKQWQNYNPIIGFDEDDDVDWTEARPKEENLTPNEVQMGDTIFTRIVHILETNPMLKVVFTCHTENKDKIMGLFPPKASDYIHSSFVIQRYTLMDTKQFYLFALDVYRKQNSLAPVPYNRYFPLTEDIISLVVNHANGNPRDCIRLFQKAFDAIIFEEAGMEQLKKLFRNLQL